jgi:hypothetical protein
MRLNQRCFGFLHFPLANRVGKIKRVRRIIKLLCGAEFWRLKTNSHLEIRLSFVFVHFFNTLKRVSSGQEGDEEPLMHVQQ